MSRIRLWWGSNFLIGTAQVITTPSEGEERLQGTETNSYFRQINRNHFEIFIISALEPTLVLFNSYKDKPFRFSSIVFFEANPFKRVFKAAELFCKFCKFSLSMK